MKLKIFLPLFLLLTTFASFSQDAGAKFKATADKVYGAFNSGDLDDLDKYFDASYNEHNLSPGVTTTGVAGLKESIAKFRAAFPDIHFAIVDWAFDGKSKGTILTHLTGTNTGSFMGMPATNKKVDFMGLDYVTLNSDGKVIEHWGFSDDLKMMQQLGMGK